VPGPLKFFSDGAKSNDVNITIPIEGHLRELLGERDRGGKRLGERGTGQEGIPSSLEESQLVDLGEAGEEEGYPGVGRSSDELDGDERVRRKGVYQGGFDDSQVDPEAIDLYEIIGGRHNECGRD